ncbi:MAG: hypothetical protein QXI92_02810 [Candidatus Nitrosocaldus sp.]
MGAKLTNTRTGASITLAASPSTAPVLEAYVGDTLRLDYTITNTGGSSGQFYVVWATGEGDIKSSTVSLGPNQSTSGYLSYAYKQPYNQFVFSFYVVNVNTNKVDSILYGQLIVYAPAQFRIDDPPLRMRIRQRIQNLLLM